MHLHITLKKIKRLFFLYLFILNYYFYACAISNKPEIIEFITTFITFELEISLNPRSNQTFSVKNTKLIK